MHDIEFTGLSIPAHLLDTSIRQKKGPYNPLWTRVEFEIPDNYNAPSRVEEWIINNLDGEFSSYWFPNNQLSYNMVVKFSDHNDALMFKLRGGHMCWEET